MNRTGHQFLTGPRFACDENGCAGWRYARDLLSQPPNYGASPGDLRGTFKPKHRVAEPFVFTQEQRVLDGASRRGEQRFRYKRLADKIKRSTPHAFNRKFDRRKGS